MSAYLFLPEEDLVSYVHQQEKPEDLGILLVKYFNTANIKQLFSKKIHHIEKNYIEEMSTYEALLNGFSLFPQEMSIDIQGTVELQSYKSMRVHFTYVFQGEMWICYASYNKNNKRIIEEIHLYNDHFRKNL